MSFLSVEPQSRVVIESHSNSLLTQFDKQLGVIANRYLAFFQERRRIEATYIDSLRKLHRKAKAVDASLNPRAEPTTMRAAWDTVRENLEREADTQQAFMDMLDNDVIGPITTFKESKDEIRKQIEEDLKGSAARYADHAENVIQKLQQAYLKKYYPQQHAHSTNSPQRPQDVPNKRFGDKVSTLFRARREDFQDPEPAKSEEVSDDDYRRAVCILNSLRLMRGESLGDGYDCLEDLVFATTIKNALVKYVDGMATACVKHDDLATSTRIEVEKALAETDTSDLRASLRRTLSFSIPQPTLYLNYPGAYSDLIFGVPLVDLTTNRDNVPKVMRMCIEEVDKRGLDAEKIYSSGSGLSAEVLQLRRRFESDKSFSFNSTDDIYSVATLLRRYLWDLPEPLFILSLRDYRQYKYRQNGARYTENDLSLLRSKIRELPLVHRASLRFLLQHLSRVASHSDKNGMTVTALAAHFRNPLLRGHAVLQDGVDVKVLVLEDLIRNAHTLFDERPSPSPPVPSPDVAEKTSTYTYSSLFLSPEFPQPAEVQAMGSTTRYRPGLVGGIFTSTQSSFSSLPSDAAMESRLISSSTALLSPLLGFPSSQTFTEGVEMTTRERVIPEVRGTEVVETLHSTPAEVVSVLPTSVTEWRYRQSRLHPYPEAAMIPQSPPESMLSGTSDFPLSSATSLQTGMGRFSP